MLGAAVLSCVGTHPLGILGRVVDGAWGSHEGRRGPHGVEHVWSKTCRNKVGSFRQSNRNLMCVYCCFKVLTPQLADSCASQMCTSPIFPELLPLFSVQLGAIPTRHTSLLTDKSWWGNRAGVCNTHLNVFYSTTDQRKYMHKSPKFH